MQEMKPGLSRVEAITGGRCGKFKTKQKNVSQQSTHEGQGDTSKYCTTAAQSENNPKWCY